MISNQETTWPHLCLGKSQVIWFTWDLFHGTENRGFPTRMVYLYYVSCLRYTILVRNPWNVNKPKWQYFLNDNISSGLESGTCVWFPSNSSFFLVAVHILQQLWTYCTQSYTYCFCCILECFIFLWGGGGGGGNIFSFSITVTIMQSNEDSCKMSPISRCSLIQTNSVDRILLLVNI